MPCTVALQVHGDLQQKGFSTTVLHEIKLHVNKNMKGILDMVIIFFSY